MSKWRELYATYYKSHSGEFLISAWQEPTFIKLDPKADFQIKFIEHGAVVELEKRIEYLRNALKAHCYCEKLHPDNGQCEACYYLANDEVKK